MEEYKISLTDTAIQDIIEAADYITLELYDREAADKLVDKIYNTIESLSNMPERHKILENAEGFIPKGIRRIEVQNYSVFYTCSSRKLEVVVWRVAYNKREWEKLLD